jgi:hypothetical protein
MSHRSKVFMLGGVGSPFQPGRKAVAPEENSAVAKAPPRGKCESSAPPVADVCDRFVRADGGQQAK